MTISRRQFLHSLTALPFAAGGLALPALNALAQQASHPLAARFHGGARAWVEGDFLHVATRCLPDHASPYYFDVAAHGPAGARHEGFQGTNPMGYRFRQSPGRIEAQEMVMRVPLKPQKADVVMPTPMGPIGIALNGVPLFNQFAAGRRPLTHEVMSFDQFGGHPSPNGIYHYHIEPVSLTRKLGRESLMGFLLDGFPVYGTFENGREITNGDLDACHGHTHATAEYPEGTYHYHFTREDPYLNGQGFFGQRGSIVRASIDIENAVCHTPVA